MALLGSKIIKDAQGNRFKCSFARGRGGAEHVACKVVHDSTWVKSWLKPGRYLRPEQVRAQAKAAKKAASKAASAGRKGRKKAAKDFWAPDEASYRGARKGYRSAKTKDFWAPATEANLAKARKTVRAQKAAKTRARNKSRKGRK